MKNQDKIILIFYVILGVSFVSAVLYVDSTFDKSSLPNILPKEITEVKVHRTISVNHENLFLTFVDLESYPLILPKNVLNVSIINQSQNYLIANSTIMEKGIKNNLSIKQVIEPYETHSIEVISGDAKGTTIKQFFSSNGTHTNLETVVNFKLKGILSSFLFIPENNIVHAINTVIDEVVYYSTVNTSKERKIVDNLYREILYRPADPEGLQKFSNLLKQQIITIDELRNQLLESDEAKNILSPNEVKNIDELKQETKFIVTELYEEILNRPADPLGLQHFGSLLESEKISEPQLKQILLNSEEKRSMEKAIVKQLIKQQFPTVPFEIEFNLLPSTEFKKIDEVSIDSKSLISQLYVQKLPNPPEPYITQYFGSLLDYGSISKENLANFLNSQG